MYLGRLCGVGLMFTVSAASAQEPPTPRDCAGLAANSIESVLRSCHGEVVDPAEAALLGQDPLSGPPFSSDHSFDSISGEAGSLVDPSQVSVLLDDVGDALSLPRSTARAGPLVQIDGVTWASEQDRLRSRVDDAAEPATRDVVWQASPRLLPLTPIAVPHVEVDGRQVPMEGWLEGSLPGRRADPVAVAVPDGELVSSLPLSGGAMRSAVIDGVTVEMGPASYRLMELILRSAGVANAEAEQAAQSGGLERFRE